MITESVAVESINLLLCWNTISFYIVPLQRHYCNDNMGVARSFPERCNLERPYNMLWALAHNFESVSGRAANEICFDWRTSISHSQTIPLTCAFSPDFIVAPSTALASMSTSKANAVRVRKRRVRSRHHVYLSGN